MLYVTSKMMVLMLNWPEKDIPLVAILIWLVTLIYTSMGGIRGVVITDVVQFFILLGGGLLAVGLVRATEWGDSVGFPLPGLQVGTCNPFSALTRMCVPP